MSEQLGEKPVTGTQSIDRACDLLIRVMNSEDPQTLSELVAATGLAKGTTSRILSALERSGLIARSTVGGFEAGPVLNQFAVRGGAYTALIGSLTPAMERIADITHETVSLAVTGHNGIDNIAQVEGSYLLGSRNWVGESVPAHCSAAGKVLIAFGGATGAEHIGATHHRNHHRFCAILDQHIRKAREVGYAVIRNELEQGSNCSCHPSTWVPMARRLRHLSVSGPAERITPGDELHIAQLMRRELNQVQGLQQEGAA
jgi:IclR family transcriptional regulator, acetate operon repressor